LDLFCKLSTSGFSGIHDNFVNLLTNGLVEAQNCGYPSVNSLTQRGSSMARPKASVPTQRESQIMAVLWEARSATAEEIRKQLPGNPHDSTVRTLLRVLVEKGQVIAEKVERSTSYRPAVQRPAVQKQVVRDLLKRFFSGSAEDLVLQLLEDECLSPQQLKAIQVAHRRRTKRETDR